MLTLMNEWREQHCMKIYQGSPFRFARLGKLPAKAECLARPWIELGTLIGKLFRRCLGIPATPQVALQAHNDQAQ
jgi:hypothetical protein